MTQDESSDRVAYVALNVVQDKVGDTPVAWSAMLYRPEVAAWGTGHGAHAVDGLRHHRPLLHPRQRQPGSDEYQTWCDVENLNHWTAATLNCRKPTRSRST